jgi:hypothetical protein
MRTFGKVLLFRFLRASLYCMAAAAGLFVGWELGAR